MFFIAQRCNLVNLLSCHLARLVPNNLIKFTTISFVWLNYFQFVIDDAT